MPTVERPFKAKKNGVFVLTSFLVPETFKKIYDVTNQE